MEQADETAITEIMIQPDGRIYVFGTSRRVLAVLGELCPNDVRLRERLAQAGPSTIDRLGDSYISLRTSE
jgi:hypothetical protein